MTSGVAAQCLCGYRANLTVLAAPLASGSYLVISHPASDVKPAAIAEMTRRINSRMGPSRGTLRDRA